MSVHGTARFATREELERAGLLGDWTPGAAVNGLLLGWWRHDKGDFEPISYQGDLHQLIVGGIGGGKFTTAIAPLLLGSGLEENMVLVVDPKGEIAQLAGPFFQTPFAGAPNVILLDPWDVCGTGTSFSLNVLDDIRPENPSYVDDARALADAMVISSGAENTHWDNAARNFLAGLILYVALSPDEKGNRSLPRIRQLVTQTWAMPKAFPGPKRPTLYELLLKHRDSDLAGGAMASAFRGLINREDKERSGIISSIDRDTAWMDSPQMARVLGGPSIDLKEAVLEGGKYFIALPPQYVMTHRAWLRIMVTAFSNAMKRYQPGKDKPQERRWRHIVIDEFATLGEMPFILNDLAIGRGFNIKYHLAVQDLAQLNRLYKDGWHSFINASFQRFFAVSDLFTADQVSRIAGSATVQSESRGESTSWSDSRSQGLSQSTSEGHSTPPGVFRFSTRTDGTSESVNYGSSESEGRSSSQNTSQVHRYLLTPDEVRRLGPDEQIIAMRGMHPIRCWRPPYWEIFPWHPLPFDLTDVLGTVGRGPEDEAERSLFGAWRDGPLLTPPAALAARQPAPTPASEQEQGSEPAARREQGSVGIAPIQGNRARAVGGRNAIRFGMDRSGRVSAACVGMGWPVARSSILGTVAAFVAMKIVRGETMRQRLNEHILGRPGGRWWNAEAGLAACAGVLFWVGAIASEPDYGMAGLLAALPVAWLGLSMRQAVERLSRERSIVRGVAFARWLSSR